MCIFLRHPNNDMLNITAMKYKLQDDSGSLYIQAKLCIKDEKQHSVLVSCCEVNSKRLEK